MIIGLLGPAGSGKSSVAAYLVEKYGATRYSLAAPLKEIARRTMGFTEEQVNGTQAQKETIDERYGMTPRQFLQRLGTDGLREVFGADVWIDLLLAKIGRERPDIAVVEDVRFENEAMKIRAMTSFKHDARSIRPRPVGIGFVWRLENPARAAATSDDGSHTSEREWASAPYDFIIAPVGRGLDQLHQLVDDAARHYVLFPKRREVSL